MDCQWKIIFNPGVSKHAQEVAFSRKAITTNHATVYFNSDPVIKENFQKHLGLFVDSLLIRLLVILIKMLKRPLKVSMLSGKWTCHYHGLPFWQYKSFFRPRLDHSDVIYDQTNNSSLSNKFESVQCNTVLAITGAIKGTSKEKFYQELRLESLRNRRWLRRISYYLKLFRLNRLLICMN